jgi:hypothetical protein
MTKGYLNFNSINSLSVSQRGLDLVFIKIYLG